MRKQLVALTAFAVGLGLAAPAGAVTYTVTDLNSSLTLDDTSGFVNWTVDGVSHLFLESYYARVGAGAAVLLTPASVLQVGNVLIMSYNAAGYGVIQMNHTLFGGALGSNASGWGTQLGFRADANAQTLNLYTYDDMDIGGTAAGDTVTYLGLGQYIQSDPASIGELNRWGSNITPNFCSAGAFVNSNRTAAFAVNLNNSCNFGPGDATFSNQYTNPTPFSIDRSIRTPEPGTLMLLGFGLLGLGAAARRKV